jgi:hypothetical protein
MERKGFLTAAIGVATAVVGTALAAAAAPGSVVAPPTIVPATMAPKPRSSGMQGEYWSNRNVSRTRIKLEHVIDELNRDQHDYGGHRVKALDLLRQARQELLAAEAFEKAHPNQ